MERILGFAPIVRAILTLLAGLICLGYIGCGENSVRAVGITVGFMIIVAAAWIEANRFMRLPMNTEENGTLAEMENQCTEK